MSGSSPFAGVMPVLHLPLDGDGGIEWDALAGLVERMLTHGADGLVVLGLATEVWTMSREERERALRTAADALAGRAPLVAGLDGETDTALRDGERLLELGADALMVRPPAGLADPVAHYEALAGRLPAPLLIQDAPAGTGVDLGVEQLVELHRRTPALRSVKVERPAGGPRISALVAAGLDVVGGWGGLHYLEALARGAIGCMPGCDLGPAFVAIHRHAAAGEHEDAERLYRAVLPLLAYEAQSLQLLVAGAKRALARAGALPSAEVRGADARLDPVQAATFDRLFERLEGDGVPGW